MKNNKAIIIGLIVVGIAAAAFWASSGNNTQKSVVNELLGGEKVVVYKSPTCGCCEAYSSYLKSEGITVDVQNVVLGIKNYNYYPNTINVKVGMPVRISLDNSVVGCYRSFTIKELGIAKNLQTPNDYVEFVPEKKGTYRFACSMGMGHGTLIVE